MKFEFKNLRNVQRAFDEAERLVKKQTKEAFNDIGQETAKRTKDTIRSQKFHSWSGNHSKELSKATIKARKQGVYWNGARVSPTNRKRALIQTGNLLNSIKYYKAKKELRMADYGMHHEKGFANYNANMTVMRKFITSVSDKKQKKIYFDKIIKPLKKIFNK
tara:strand:+ start:373 stop:858 length:486 start_codon:yes stop_codon:yes gene_type:complete